MAPTRALMLMLTVKAPNLAFIICYNIYAESFQLMHDTRFLSFVFDTLCFHICS